MKKEAKWHYFETEDFGNHTACGLYIPELAYPVRITDRISKITCKKCQRKLCRMWKKFYDKEKDK